MDMGHQQRDSRESTNAVLFSLQIGLFAGLIWGLLRLAFFEMNMTRVLPGYMLEPFFRHSFLNTVPGIAIGIGGYVLFSAAAALLYRVLMGKLRGPWPGMLYGAGWSLLFGAIGPWLGMMPKLNEIGWNSIITEFCIFVLWGLFIGYSIAFEFTDEASREPIGAK